MISGDLNQLLKKIKRHRSLHGPTLHLSLVSSSLSCSLLHDNESLPCREKGIICGTGSKMPREPHYRMHDYHDSGAALVSTSYSLSALPRPFSFLLVQIFQPAAQKEDPSSSSETSRSKHRLEWNLDRWNGKSTTRPGSRVEELERLSAPGITSSTSDCLSGKGELQVSRGWNGWILFMEEM